VTDAARQDPRPPGFLHVDLDGLWTLAACYGFEEGDCFEHDPVFEIALPRLLDLFDRLGARATFFIVARDLELEEKRDAIAEIVRRGHELGNHTYHHAIGLERMDEARIAEEIGRAQSAIGEIAGAPPIGFRAPGYAAGPKVLRAAQAAGLRYDGSLLPTPWAAVLRFLAGRFRVNSSEASSIAARAQYGEGRAGRNALAPQWFRGDPSRPPLLRLPLAVSPTLGLPLHASLGMMLGRGATLRGLERLAALGWPIAYLLHGMDALGPESFADRLPPKPARSRAFGTALDRRLEFLQAVLARVLQLTRVELSADYVKRIES
jgi:hypothetical protein